MLGICQVGPLHLKGIVLSFLCLAFLLAVWQSRLFFTIKKVSINNLHSVSSIQSTQNSDDKKDSMGQYKGQEDKLKMKILKRATQMIRDDEDLAVDIWMNHGHLKYDDPLLVEYVRQKYIFPPDSIGYNITTDTSETNPSDGQVQALWEYLKNITHGFFIDCGANNGEFLSNSLWLEKEKGWNGILIEADPTTFSTLKSKHRKSWHSNLCLSPRKTPSSVPFYQNPRMDGVNGLNKRPEIDATIEIKVQCIPLYTILLGLKRKVIDFFSLDIEGFELEVLKTIPFDKTFIKTLAIEHWSIPEGASGLAEFMKKRGYTLLQLVEEAQTRDSIFVHNSLLPSGGLRRTGGTKYKMTTTEFGIDE